jgi:signal transduction histidine kinase
MSGRIAHMNMRFKLTPPQTFTVLSLLFIVSMVVVTNLTQSPFFRQAIINREVKLIRDLANALAVGQGLSWSDMQNYTDAGAKEHLDLSFQHLKKLTRAVRIKVFNHNKTIVWSDEPSLIGTGMTMHRDDLSRSMDGEARAVFDPARSRSNKLDKLPDGELIEFYVPLFLSRPGENDVVDGVLSLYRSPQELNDTIQYGLYRLWLVTGTGGTILFYALYRLFRSVYQRQREVESQFAKLSADHGRIIQIEKLSAMGQMVSEIAHQLNNPLVGVINLAQLAEREESNSPRVNELLGEIQKAGDHCRKFVKRMLRFTKVAHSEPRLTEMKSLAQETIHLFQQSIGNYQEVILEAPDHDVILEVDPVLMRHALFNLIHNATQADPSGKLSVSIASEEYQGTAGCQIAVSDCGSGIKPEMMEKIFTPFFSTKPDGTGLGLSVVQHIVAQHAGTIRAENKPGGGARFVIWLPEKQGMHEIENPAC